MCITCCFPRTYQKRSFWANLRATEWPLENKQISGGVLSFFFGLINKKLGVSHHAKMVCAGAMTQKRRFLLWYGKIIALLLSLYTNRLFTPRITTASLLQANASTHGRTSQKDMKSCGNIMHCCPRFSPP